MAPHHRCTPACASTLTQAELLPAPEAKVHGAGCHGGSDDTSALLIKPDTKRNRFLYARDTRRQLGKMKTDRTAAAIKTRATMVNRTTPARVSCWSIERSSRNLHLTGLILNTAEGSAKC